MNPKKRFDFDAVMGKSVGGSEEPSVMGAGAGPSPIPVLEGAKKAFMLARAELQETAKSLPPTTPAHAFRVMADFFPPVDIGEDGKPSAEDLEQITRKIAALPQPELNKMIFYGEAATTGMTAITAVLTMELYKRKLEEVKLSEEGSL